MSDLPHPYGFDPTYGYTLDELLKVQPPEEPADAEGFWVDTYQQTISTLTRLESVELPSPREGFRVQLVRFESFGGLRVGAWLVTPANDEPTRFIVCGHGYYNRPIEDISYSEHCATLFFSCRGLGISRTAGISDQTMFHVLHGIESKETYIHRGCVADTWATGSAMLELFPHAAGRLEYHGESFGGGIGAMAMAWDNRFNYARLFIPSFGQQAIRLKCRCTGSGDAVRRKYERQPQIYENTLRYFDAATHATRIKIPTFFACATFDPAVPPPGQFAIHNAVPGAKKLTVWRTGHHDWAGSVADAERAASDEAAFRASVPISHI